MGQRLGRKSMQSAMGPCMTLLQRSKSAAPQQTSARVHRPASLLLYKQARHPQVIVIHTGTLHEGPLHSTHLPCCEYPAGGGLYKY